jgi:chemotaxis methyl-accepting protein methylase
LQRAMLDRIGAVLREGGYLVIGAHEQLLNCSRLFAPVAGCREVFQKA